MTIPPVPDNHLPVRDNDTINVSEGSCLRYVRRTGRARSNCVTSSRTTDFVRRLTDPDPAVAAQVDNPDEITARILRAAIEQAELVGMRRSTMDDVARRSGVGRATLYRRFPTKAALNEAIVLSEVRRFLEGGALARS